MTSYRSEYENYILVSEGCKYLTGTYPGFLRGKEIMSTLNSMVSKQTNTYTYNGEVYVSKLTNGEINNIQKSLDYGTYSPQLNKLKYVCMDIGVRAF